jgi:hypothetical protein
VVVAAAVVVVVVVAVVVQVLARLRANKINCCGYSCLPTSYATKYMYIGRSESNASAHVSCAGGATLKQYLSQLVHWALSYSFPCGMACET